MNAQLAFPGKIATLINFRLFYPLDDRSLSPGFFHLLSLSRKSCHQRHSCFVLFVGSRRNLRNASSFISRSKSVTVFARFMTTSQTHALIDDDMQKISELPKNSLKTFNTLIYFKVLQSRCPIVDQIFANNCVCSLMANR